MSGRLDEAVHDRRTQALSAETLRIDLADTEIVHLPEHRIQVGGDALLIAALSDGTSVNIVGSTFRICKSAVPPQITVPLLNKATKRS